MKEVITMRSVQLTDEDIAFCISAVCTKLLGRPVTCRTYCDVNEYWGAISDEQKFTTKELLDLLVAVNADAETVRETIPTDECASGALGMDLSRGLLKLALGTDWVWEHILVYAVSALLIANGIQVKSHEGVRQQLGLHFVLTGKISKELGQFYGLLFSKRTAGDYEDFLTHDKATAEALYPRCVEFISQISALAGDGMKS